MPKQDPDLAGLPSLDGDGDEPTAKEVAAVLRELGLGAPAPAPKAKPAAEARPAAKSDGQAARAPPAATGIGAVVGERVEAYQRAAAVASGRGDADAANQLLRRGLELNQALLLVLQQFPDPEAKPEPPAATPAAAANAAGAPVVSAAEIAAAVSARVVQSMVDQLGEGDSGLLLQLLERKAQIEARVEANGVDCDALRAAIEVQKGEATRYKAAGDTSAAVRALRRAKLMMEEIAEIEGS